jgi:hypothetical protein
VEVLGVDGRQGTWSARCCGYDRRLPGAALGLLNIEVPAHRS